MKKREKVYGLMAEFATADEILDATRRARQEGYAEMDAYTPYSVEGLAEELGLTKTCVPFVVLVCGLVGAACGFWMQFHSMAVDYRFNVGGRPPNSWPAFIPVAFEIMVLVASLAAFLGMFFLNGLPRLNHPVFSAPRFEHASQDRFFLCIEATDPRYDAAATEAFLRSCSPYEIVEVFHAGEARVLPDATDSTAPSGEGKEESP